MAYADEKKNIAPSSVSSFNKIQTENIKIKLCLGDFGTCEFFHQRVIFISNILDRHFNKRNWFTICNFKLLTLHCDIVSLAYHRPVVKLGLKRRHPSSSSRISLFWFSNYTHGSNRPLENKTSTKPAYMMRVYVSIRLAAHANKNILTSSMH